MSALLALTAAMAGTVFDCEVVTRKFSVFAPESEVTANYRGNVLTLYKFEAEEDAFGADAKIDQVFDGLPHSLFVSLDDGSGSPVEITIFELDQDAGTARVTIMENLTPGADSATMIGLEGSCSFMRQNKEDQA